MGADHRRIARRALAVALLASAVAAVAAAATLAGSGTDRASPPDDPWPVAARPTQSVRCGWGTFRPGRWPTACWRPYGPSSPFNRRVPSHPRVLADSQAMISAIFSTGTWSDLLAGVADTSRDYSHPLYFSRPTDPIFTIHCTEPWGRCAIEGARVRIPAGSRPAGGSDAHLAVIDQRAGWEWDFWKVQGVPRRPGTLAIGWGGRVRILGSGVDDQATKSGATAANQGLAAGQITAAELNARHIDHALTMTVDCTHGVVYPATGTAATCDDPDLPPDGQWVYLALTDAQIRALKLPAWKATILTALAHYGAYVTDTGGAHPSLFLLSGSTYTSFGTADPLVAYARGHRGHGIRRDGSGTYHFDLASGIDWTADLRAIASPRR